MKFLERVERSLLYTLTRAPTPLQAWLARRVAAHPELLGMPPMQALLLTLINASPGPAPEQQTIHAARRRYEVFASATDTGWPTGVAKNRGHLPGGAGPRPALTYHASTSARGTILYLHGGGFTIGSPETHEPVCRMLALETGCTVHSLDYRLAPEHPFPAGVEDAWNAYLAIQSDPHLPVFLAGDSAGGNLAAVVTARAIHRGRKPPAGLALIYPSANLTDHGASERRYGDGYLLTRSAITYFVDQYLPVRDLRHTHDASPVLFDRLAEFPPTWVATAGFDPLQDDGIAFARALADAGASVHHRHDDSLIHGYVHLIARVAEARAAVADAAEFIRARLAPV